MNFGKHSITDIGRFTSEDHVIEENEDWKKVLQKISNLFDGFFVNMIWRSTGEKPASQG